VQATAAPEAPAPEKQTGGWQRPDAAGRYGQFGGKYVPETLIPALAELEVAYQEAMADPAFQVGISEIVGRPFQLRGCLIEHFPIQLRLVSAQLVFLPFEALTTAAVQLHPALWLAAASHPDLTVSTTSG
jgi:hypothetical protein